MALIEEVDLTQPPSASTTASGLVGPSQGVRGDGTLTPPEPIHLVSNGRRSVSRDETKISSMLMAVPPSSTCEDRPSPDVLTIDRSRRASVGSVIDASLDIPSQSSSPTAPTDSPPPTHPLQDSVPSESQTLPESDRAMQEQIRFIEEQREVIQEQRERMAGIMADLQRLQQMTSAEGHAAPPPRRPWYLRVHRFFGFGKDNKPREALVSWCCSVFVDSAQIVVIIVLLTFAAHHRSPVSPDENEWQACHKILGVWNALWAPRCAIDLYLATWRWRLQRAKRRKEAGDAENGTASASGDTETGQRSNEGTNTHPLGPRGSLTAGSSRGVRADTRESEPRLMDFPRPRESPITGSGRGVRADTRESEPRPIDFPRSYTRISGLSLMFSLAWFLIAHVFAFTTTNTYRIASPHIWWLTFAILCMTYIAIAEVILMILFIFIVMPILLLLYSIVLLCLGRHPLQNPHYIKPEITKLPKSVVERIPLVTYIPSPPDEPAKPFTIPEAAHLYPPKPSAPPPMPKKRFRFLRLKRKVRAAKGDAKGTAEGKDSGEPLTWEDNWEKGEYPFVRLEENRAACSICLMDFGEPKRVVRPGIEVEDKDKEGGKDKLVEEVVVEELPVAQEGDREEGNAQDSRESELSQEDADEEAQPLRLLQCGHVFHSPPGAPIIDRPHCNSSIPRPLTGSPSCLVADPIFNPRHIDMPQVAQNPSSASTSVQTFNDTGIQMVDMNQRQKDNSGQTLDPKHRVDDKAWFSESFFSKEASTSSARTLYLKIVLASSLLVTVWIMAVLPIYWGALWQFPEHTHNLKGWVVDFDGGQIGTFVTQSFVASSGPPTTMTWETVTASQFPNGQDDLIHALVQEHAWVIVAINSNATSNLNNAVASANGSYNGSLAVTMYGEEARNENAYDMLIQPLIVALMDGTSRSFATGFARQLASSGQNTTNLAANAPQILTNPLSYTIFNARPFDVPVAAAVDFVGLIYLLIIAFVNSLINNAARTDVTHIDQRLSFRSLIFLRIVIPLCVYFYISCFFSMISLAFQVPFNRTYAIMCIYTHFSPSNRISPQIRSFWVRDLLDAIMAGDVCPRPRSGSYDHDLDRPLYTFLPDFMDHKQVTPPPNVSVCFFPIPLLPGVYRYGYAMPFYNVERAVRTIVFNTKNDYDVIASIKSDFDEYGVSEDVLAELQSKWENKVIASHVAEFEAPPPPTPPQYPPHPMHAMVQHPHYAPTHNPFVPAQAQVVPGQSHIKTEPLDSRHILANLPHPHYTVPALPGPQIPALRPPPGYPLTSARQPTAVSVPARPYSAQNIPNGTAVPFPHQQPQTYQPQPQQPQQPASSAQLQPQAARIPQADGPSSSGSDSPSPSPPQYAPRSSHPSLPQPVQQPASKPDDEAINSDLDDSDSEGEDDPEEGGPGDSDIVFCTPPSPASPATFWYIVFSDWTHPNGWNKLQVARVKNKWKCILKDGMIHVNGKDYLFAKCTGYVLSLVTLRQGSVASPLHCASDTEPRTDLNSDLMPCCLLTFFLTANSSGENEMPPYTHTSSACHLQSPTCSQPPPICRRAVFSLSIYYNNTWFLFLFLFLHAVLNLTPVIARRRISKTHCTDMTFCFLYASPLVQSKLLSIISYFRPAHVRFGRYSTRAAACFGKKLG
ncbi:hypothetical protein EW146_g2279 [Bondarzewia mesenterica]|uniref:DUF3533 domain-containing protein n=1 Tax=Bondarzewia mesenterica TaxID=1095465 RepID=A0A4S4M7A9_9AGAM|nr:hypothetical protein EW146_g2279 [Bondarzewia mesenterica]